MRLAKIATLFALLFLPACATVVEGTTDTVTLVTEPAGARCAVAREGVELGQVSPTPGPLSLSKSRNPLTVSCDKTGHLTTARTVESEFTGTTFGNILLGGVIGAVADAASGANNRYPQTISLTLVPETFASLTALEEYFTTQANQIHQQYDAADRKHTDMCPQNQADSCADALKASQARRAADLAQLNQQRSQARVAVD